MVLAAARLQVVLAARLAFCQCLFERGALQVVLAAARCRWFWQRCAAGGSGRGALAGGSGSGALQVVRLAFCLSG